VPELRESSWRRGETTREIGEKLRRLGSAQEGSGELGKARDGENANGGYGQNRVELVVERRGWDWRGREVWGEEDSEGELWDKTNHAKPTRRGGARANDNQFTPNARQGGGHHVH
jgi:hypothetical protein